MLINGKEKKKKNTPYVIEEMRNNNFISQAPIYYTQFFKTIEDNSYKIPNFQQLLWVFFSFNCTYQQLGRE